VGERAADDARQLAQAVALMEGAARWSFGTVKTYWRCDTGARTPSPTHSP